MFLEDPITGDRVELSPANRGMNIGIGFSQLAVSVMGITQSGSLQTREFKIPDSFNPHNWLAPPAVALPGVDAVPISTATKIAVPYPTSGACLNILKCFTIASGCIRHWVTPSSLPESCPVCTVRLGE